MTAPPPGWYPDPEAAGRQWRWWDGVGWAPPGYGYAPAFDPAAHAHAVAQQARSTASTGQWLRWAMAGYAAASVLLYAAIGALFYGARSDWFTNDAESSVHASSWFAGMWALAAPFQLLQFVFMILLIVWIYNAGRFAELQRWPAVRGRTLGACSLLIPIVNFWWPYEAVRDAFPPGRSPPFLIKWWLSYLLVPLVSLFAVAVAGLSGSALAAALFVLFAAVLAPFPVVFGWRLVRALDDVQRAHTSR